MAIRSLRWLVLSVLILFSWAANSATVVGVVRDGPPERPLIPVDVIEKELAALTGDEFDVRIPEDKRLDGDWTLAGVRAALKRLLADPEVDIVLCFGVVACNEASLIPNLPKPMIASIVVDPGLQSFPIKDGASGKRNFIYVTNFRSIDSDIQAFKTAVDFKNLGILVDKATLDALPVLEDQKAIQLQRDQGVTVTVIKVGDSLDEAIAAIPATVDAIYITPLYRFSAGAIRRLSDALIERRLPSFSLYGVSEVEMGLLLANGGRSEDQIRVARRIALNIQRILLGERPRDVPVALQQAQRLAINMRTAEAIGYSPSYAVLTDAEQLFLDQTETGTPLALLDAMTEAVDANLGLRVAGFDPLLAGEDVRESRSALLPQLEAGAGWTRIDSDRANPLFQSEESTDVDLVGRQLIYADNAWAAYRITQYLRTASDEAYRGAVLDTLQASGRIYLALLQAIAREGVQRSNLEVTRTNLGLARVRESIGFTGRADVLRWESRIAVDRRNLISAEATRRQAGSQLNQVLNRPQSTQIEPLDASVESALAFFTQPRFRSLIDNAYAWETFKDFVVQQGNELSPEISQSEQFVLAGERDLKASQRRFWLPEFGLQASGSENLNRSGVGSNVGPLGLDDTSWTVGVVASLPVFSGGKLRSDLSRSRYSLRQVEQQRAAVTEDVETQIRVTMEEAASTFAAIELSAAAAAASAENLRIVTDSYSKGALNVTDLIDAQNAALSADLDAAQAKYIYISAVIDVLRASGDFSMLLDPDYAEQWFGKIEAFFAEQGIPLRF